MVQWTKHYAGKKKGDSNVEKLRTILLYEADFNMLNRKLGSDMITQAEKYNLVAEEQYGSRKKLSSILHCINNVITFDLLRQQKRSAAICSNDAKGCYDRVVHNFGSICLQRLGAPAVTVKCMFETIQRLRHYVRTVHGDSEMCIDCSQLPKPCHGVGQGNAAGPHIWVAISTPLLKMMCEQGHLGHFTSCISGEKTSFVGYSFVDDTDLIRTTTKLQASFEQIWKLMQKSINDWEGGLRVSGGALAPDKSFWYMVLFKWNKGKWTYEKIKNHIGDLNMRDINGIRKPIQRLECKEGRRTLGVRCAPDGNWNEEFNYLLNQSKEWAEMMRTGHLPRDLSWKALHSTIIKKLEYSLPATFLSKRQCDKIASAAFRQGLGQAGIQRKIAMAIRHGDLMHQGLGLPDLYISGNIATCNTYWNGDRSVKGRAH